MQAYPAGSATSAPCTQRTATSRYCRGGRKGDSPRDVMQRTEAALSSGKVSSTGSVACCLPRLTMIALLTQLCLAGHCSQDRRVGYTCGTLHPAVSAGFLRSRLCGPLGRRTLALNQPFCVDAEEAAFDSRNCGTGICQMQALQNGRPQVAASGGCYLW